jgi:hypothetical protein
LPAAYQQATSGLYEITYGIVPNISGIKKALLHFAKGLYSIYARITASTSSISYVIYLERIKGPASCN